jgi:hypothetical protein
VLHHFVAHTVTTSGDAVSASSRPRRALCELRGVERRGVSERGVSGVAFIAEAGRGGGGRGQWRGAATTANGGHGEALQSGADLGSRHKVQRHLQGAASGLGCCHASQGGDHRET